MLIPTTWVDVSISCASFSTTAWLPFVVDKRPKRNYRTAHSAHLLPPATPTTNMADRQRVNKVMTQPIVQLFKFLQNVRQHSIAWRMCVAPPPSAMFAENSCANLALRKHNYQAGGANHRRLPCTVRLKRQNAHLSGASPCRVSTST